MKILKLSLVLTMASLGAIGVWVWEFQKTGNEKTSEVSTRDVIAKPEGPEASQRLELTESRSMPNSETGLAAFFASPFDLKDGARERTFELATDQLYIRHPEGSSRIMSIPAADSPESFAQALAKARSETGVEPELVLYPAGSPRNESTRRIVTREVVINAPTRAAADAIAAEKGFVFLNAPVFAPNAFVYEAATSLDALAARSSAADSTLPSASPLLASLTTRRVMPNDPLVQLQWHLKFQNQAGAVPETDINVEKVWNYPSTNSENSTRGRNVVIGIVDDGLEWSHPDLVANVLKNLQYDWNGKDGDPMPDLLNGDNHGTACAGVAAARGNNRLGVSGVAPEAKLVGMRLIANEKTDLDEAEAFTWKPDNIQILSNSWGPDDTGDVLEGPKPLALAALKYAADFGRQGKGTIITWAGGNGLDNNDNSNYDGYANSIYTIAVAAMDSQGVQASYSESGANLVITAPSDGNAPALGIMTTDNKGKFGYNPGIYAPLPSLLPPGEFLGSGDVTKTFGGTSSACPVVSGVVALMLEKNPNLGWRDVQEILIRSAAQVDAGDPDWITANRTDHITGNQTVPFHFNHKYGAGLVDADEAVRLSGNWTNLAPQQMELIPSRTVLTLGPNSTITQNFTANRSLRAEHVTLKIRLEEIKKGDLHISLKSPLGTESVFCEPHSDQSNEFIDWTFMSVRNWAETSNGTWTLTITNNGTSTGNLTNAELVVYGSDPLVTTGIPVVTVQAKPLRGFVGTPIGLNATAIHPGSSTTPRTEIRIDGQRLTSNSTFDWTPTESGNFEITAAVVDAGGNTLAVSAVETVQIDPLPLAGWDFDSENVALGTAIQGNGTYTADFGQGNGTMIFNGTFGGPVLDSPNRWDFDRGEIFVGNGTSLNSVGTFEAMALDNKALLLRGGKNLSAEGKWIVFKFDMSGYSNLRISYATTGDPKLVNGFTQHEWEWSSDGANWFKVEDISVPIGSQTADNPYGYSRVEVDGNPATPGLDPITNLDDSPDGYVRVRFTGADRLAPQGENWIDNIVFAADPIPGIDVQTLRASSSLPSAKVDDSEVSSVTPPADVSEVFNEEPVSNTLPASIAALGWKAPEPRAFRMDVSAQVVSGAGLLEAPGSALAAFDGETLVGLSQPLETGSVYSLVIWSDTAATDPLRLRAYDAATGNVHVLAEKQLFTAGASLGTAKVPVRFQSAYLEASETHSVGPGSNTLRFRVLPEDPTVENVFADYQASAGDEFQGQSGSATRGASGWVPGDLTIAGGVPVELVRKAATPTSFRVTGKAVEVPVPELSQPTVSVASSSPEPVVPVTTQTTAPAQVSSTPATPTYAPSGPIAPSEFKKSGKSAKSKKKKFKKSKRNFSN